jgi:hypothetical protein
MAALILIVSGCMTPRSQVNDDVMNQIALCGGGYDSRLGAGLKAQIAAQIRQGGSLTAEITDSIRAAFFGTSDASNENVRRAYEAYLGCLQHIRT